MKKESCVAREKKNLKIENAEGPGAIKTIMTNLTLIFNYNYCIINFIILIKLILHNVNPSTSSH